MAAVEVTFGDLALFAKIDRDKADAMIVDAMALAAQIAPCILNDDFAHPAAAKAIIRRAILRWNEAGTGAIQSTTAGPFSNTVDTSVTRRGMFWPSEITDLQRLCSSSGGARAFAVDTVGSLTANHADVCSLTFGALYCSCGADIAGTPLWEEP